MTDAGAGPLKIGKFRITSRLFVGTGKYASYELMRDALAETGCQVVVDVLHHVRVGATADDLRSVVESGTLGWVQVCDAAAAHPTDLIHEARRLLQVPGPQLAGALLLGQQRRLAAEHDRRDVGPERVGSHCLQHIPAADAAGHEDVQQHHIKLLLGGTALAEDLEGLPPVGGLDALDTDIHERVAQDLAQLAVVFNNQNSGHEASPVIPALLHYSPRRVSSPARDVSAGREPRRPR